MIELTMLPARDGDALLLSYGSDGERHRFLIDGGRAGTYADIRAVLAALDPPAVDVLVVTHVDQDHVLGVLELVADDKRVDLHDVWFNGFHHLQQGSLESFGARDGELLTTAIVKQAISWNGAFGERAIEVGRRPEAVPGGARIEVVAPDRRLLERLVSTWTKECAKHGLVPGIDPRPPVQPGFEAFGALDVEALAALPFSPDTSRTNATSIAFVFEYDDRRILFTGDGDDARIVDSVRPLAEAEGGRLRLDALKVSHHGSKGNISTELLGLIDCPRYLFSTNGSRHAHPDPEAVARILVHGGPSKELVFNYRDPAAQWDNPVLLERYHYTVTAPTPEHDGSLTLTWP